MCFSPVFFSVKMPSQIRLSTILLCFTCLHLHGYVSPTADNRRDFSELSRKSNPMSFENHEESTNAADNARFHIELRSKGNQLLGFRTKQEISAKKGQLLTTRKRNKSNFSLKHSEHQQHHNFSLSSKNSNKMEFKSRQVMYGTLDPSTTLKHTSSRQGVRTAFSATACPTSCHCETKLGTTISVVDCSSKMLIKIPKLPASAKEIWLQNNLIQVIPCTAFQQLTKLRILDLSMNRIQMLHNCSFDGLTMLEQLFLSQNQLSSFSVDVFRSLQKMLVLDLSQNMLKSLELDLFTHLGTLTRLDLGKNWLTKIQNNTFHGLSSLVFLSLRENKLHYLPGTFEIRAFQGLTSLESLHLEGNQPDFPANFTYPDQALSYITTLRRLWLDGYPRSLGPGFVSLTQLSHLSFSGNGVSHCSMGSKIPPDFFNNLSSKQPLHINMSECSFHTIPPALFKSLPNIYSLDLSLNDYLLIDGFEKASEGLQNSTLTVLNISDIVNPWMIYSEIKNTTFRYLKHTSLKVLMVKDCSLINIAPKAILDLPQSVEFINFRGNKIIDAASLLTLTKLINLRGAIVSKQLHYARGKNQVRDYHRGLLSWHIREQTVRPSHVRTNTSGTQRKLHQGQLIVRNPHLSMKIQDTFNHKLTIGSNFCGDSVNSIGGSPNTFQNDFTGTLPIPLPHKLEMLDVSDIKASYNIPQVQIINNKVLKYLDFSSNGIKCFGGPVSGLPALHYLDLSRNWCFKVNPLFFSHMSSLKTLLLYKNILGQSLAEDEDGVTFSALTSLESIDLSDNTIKDLSQFAFQHNVNLRMVSLSNNALSQFHSSLISNTKLELLDLSYNVLTGISETTCNQLLDIKRRNSNFLVRLAGNHRFLCDCDNIFFLNFILGNPEIFEDVRTFQCRVSNGSSVTYDQLARFLPQLGDQCVAQPIFIAVLIAFFLLVSSLSVCALYHFKRWQWKYLYYVGKSRLHIGSMNFTNRPVAHAFITYDQVRLTGCCGI